ncbi:A/G-specific adenine glycosylase [Novosphingobium sp.]|uniref:A/G-specific adenine glycosylase n=1 Tax=Novosphingobium sp. TaxID=1874826 RepID=UPI0025F50AE9|nr:A/G-specific adenine glycosylase [Novosphingobium sp.]
MQASDLDAIDHHPISAALLGWYDVHVRALPWRKRPGEPTQDPYRVWLSEVMLQQTTVAAVGKYYTRFLELWPTVGDLAAADESAVMAEWAGLGYYARARNLIAAARAVAASGGAFPDTEDGLRALPGLGAYTAAAVAAIAFDRRAVVVDANVERVVSRLFLIDTPLPGARPAIRTAADTITPDARAGDFAQAMMDLGATICTPRRPRCLLCPLAGQCKARAGGDPVSLPIKPAKKAKPQRTGTAYWIERDGPEGIRVWLVTRAAKGMLGAMRALPDDGWAARRDGDKVPPITARWEALGRVSHGFTHFDLELQLMRAESPDTSALKDGEWWPVAGIESAGLPTVFAKAVRLALADTTQASGDAEQ